MSVTLKRPKENLLIMKSQLTMQIIFIPVYSKCIVYIGQFKGNAEKFYPAFYKSVSEVIVFKILSRRSSVILGFEVANHVLAHLAGSTVKESTVDFTRQVSFTSKEENIIKYLSGYVFGTLYRRIRRYNSSQRMFGVQSLCILLAGKS